MERSCGKHEVLRVLGLRSVAFRVVIVVSSILIPKTRSCVSAVFANLVELSWNILRFLLYFNWSKPLNIRHYFFFGVLVLQFSLSGNFSLLCSSQDDVYIFTELLAPVIITKDSFDIADSSTYSIPGRYNLVQFHQLA